MKFNIYNNHRRTGRGQGEQLSSPNSGSLSTLIRAESRHYFRAKHNTCLNNTNLGSVTAVKGKNSAPPPPPPHHRMLSAPGDDGKCVLLPPYPPPTEYGSRKIYATIPPPPQSMDHGKVLLQPPPTESIRAKLGLPPPPKWIYISPVHTSDAVEPPTVGGTNFDAYEYLTGSYSGV